MCDVCRKTIHEDQVRKRLGTKWCCFAPDCVYIIEMSEKWRFTPSDARALLDAYFDELEARA